MKFFLGSLAMNCPVFILLVSCALLSSDRAECWDKLHPPAYWRWGVLLRHVKIWLMRINYILYIIEIYMYINREVHRGYRVALLGSRLGKKTAERRFEVGKKPYSQSPDLCSSLPLHPKLRNIKFFMQAHGNVPFLASLCIGTCISRWGK